MDPYNPIRSVDGKEVPCPSTYKWLGSDISKSGAGRTEDTVMQKKRIGQAASIELGWQNIPTEKVAQILQAFDPEYIIVEFLDAKRGVYRTSEFYVGDRSSPLYSSKLRLWSGVSFTIIERSGKNL